VENLIDQWLRGLDLAKYVDVFLETKSACKTSLISPRMTLRHSGCRWAREGDCSPPP